MKRFLIITVAVFAVLGAIFAYLLYQEGAFERKPPVTQEPTFQMKCEPGKCGGGKCGGGA